MRVNTDPYNRSQVSRRTLALTPYNLYLEQVRGISDAIRVTSSGLQYYPLQFGGLKGQRVASAEPTVIDIMDFNSKGN